MAEQRKSEGMNTPLRLLISVVSVGAMFGLGRVVRSMVSSKSSKKKYMGKPYLLELNKELAPPPTVPAKSEFDDRVVVPGDADDVYDHARRLDYFDQFLFGVDELKLSNPSSAQMIVADAGREFAMSLEVISETRGEFFGLRVENAGELYGTCLVKFEQNLTKPVGTAVSVSVKYKHKFDAPMQEALEAVVSKEIHSYLHNLKAMLEREAAATEPIS